MDVERIIDELSTRVTALEQDRPEEEIGLSAAWERIQELETRVCTLAETLHELLTKDDHEAESVSTLPKLEDNE